MSLRGSATTPTWVQSDAREGSEGTRRGQEGQKEAVCRRPAQFESPTPPLPLPEHVRRAIAEHHERLDGSSYPKGLKGEEIALPSRIIAVVDVYDALTSDRIYRKRLSREEAFEEIDRDVLESRLDGGIVDVWKVVVESEEIEDEKLE